MAARLSIGFMLDVAELGRQGAPPLDALLVTAIIDANVSRVLRDPALQVVYARLDAPPPDSLRRPVSINALAESLRLPFETVRRHVRQLVAKGVCAVCAQGVYVPSEVVSSPPFVAVQKARYQRVLRFHQELLAEGVVEPLPFTPPRADDAAAPVRAVGRILSDYFFRTLEALQSHVPDPLSGLVLLQVLQISAEHIPPQQLGSILRQGGIPEQARAPVRVAQVSRRLRTPYETTRRHIGWLVEDGLFRRVDGGVLVDQSRLESAALQELRQENLANIRRLSRGLAALEAILADSAARRAVED